MNDAPDRDHHRPIRLPGYDYAQTGAYFVTICTNNRECLFGEIVAGEMRLNPAGVIVSNEWKKTAELRGGIRLGEWVVMPNHFHGIVVIDGDGWGMGSGTARRASTGGDGGVGVGRGTACRALARGDGWGMDTGTARRASTPGDGGVGRGTACRALARGDGWGMDTGTARRASTRGDGDGWGTDTGTARRAPTRGDGDGWGTDTGTARRASTGGDGGVGRGTARRALARGDGDGWGMDTGTARRASTRGDGDGWGMDTGTARRAPTEGDGGVGRGTACRALARGDAPTAEQFGKPVSGSIPTIIRSFKSAASKGINQMRGTPGATVWQRNYYEHVIRSEASMQRIREYIINNPLQWDMDRDNPVNAARGVPTFTLPHL